MYNVPIMRFGKSVVFVVNSRPGRLSHQLFLIFGMIGQIVYNCALRRCIMTPNS